MLNSHMGSPLSHSNTRGLSHFSNSCLIHCDGCFKDVSVPKMLSEESGDEASQKLKPINRTSASVKEARHTAGIHKPQCKEDSFFFFSMTTLSSFHYFCDKNRFILWHSN